MASMELSGNVAIRCIQSPSRMVKLGNTLLFIIVIYSIKITLSECRMWTFVTLCSSLTFWERVYYLSNTKIFLHLIT